MRLAKYEPYNIADVHKASKQKLFTVVSTFAGGGGSSTGYRLAGGHILAINEFVAEAIKTYSQNFPDTLIIEGDIKDLTGEDILEKIGLEPMELDILDGSPPCSAFSSSDSRAIGAKFKGAVIDTRRTYFEDGEVVTEGELKVNDGVKVYSDGKKIEAIEDLFLEYIRIAKVIRPKVIVAENVKGMTLTTARDKLGEFIKGFEDIGYDVAFKVLNATHYGVAQARQRCFFICVRYDVAEMLGINWLNIASLFPEPTTPYGVDMERAIMDLENDPVEVQMLKDVVQNGYMKPLMDLLPKRPDKVIIPRDFHPKSSPDRITSFFNLKRPAPKLPCPTLTQMGQQRSCAGIIHFEEDRKLTITELRRLMSLPDDFVLTGTFDQKAERCGRMVAPKMMAALATSIYDKIIKPYNEKVNG